MDLEKKIKHILEYCNDFGIAMTKRRAKRLLIDFDGDHLEVETHLSMSISLESASDIFDDDDEY